ncbi:MAG TPA: CvpA family protein [Candidatus Scybalomonas excrementigallinarum]|nr:CvpA family protein [Candidatus Scybalomonas excrementigallinarum]
MKKIGKKAIIALVLLIIAGIYYYVALPAINIHSTGFWGFLIAVVVILLALYAVRKKQKAVDLKQDKKFKFGTYLVGLLIAAFIIGSVLSSPIVNAKKYQQLLTVDTREFTEDIKQVSFDKIPLLDSESAAIIGNRKMGSMVDFASQFEVSDTYTQINFNDVPVRVAPLRYASPIKWLTNQSDGIPAYMKIDMATQTAECVKLTNGTIKYSPYEYFNRNLYRHLRFRYPTYIFDNISFELDEEGTPWWTCSVKKFNIGLFGGETVGRLVLCNAITGETIDYAVEDVPQWVDRVYAPDMLIDLYDYYGTLKHGFLNSVLGQRDCLKTTEGYNYIALDDDVWVYTGVTSVTGDESNVGFVLMNQRTKETRYYAVTGAKEVSAMSSAEGQVQHLGYQATFPLLLNIGNEPTYFLALKDGAGLVKKYAMVNVQKYQVVAIGDTVDACQRQYMTLMKENGIESSVNQENLKEVTGVIERMAEAVVDGNSHYYLVLKGSDVIYDVSVADNLSIIRYQEGDRVTLEYTEGEAVNTVYSVNGETLSIVEETEDSNGMPITEE